MDEITKAVPMQFADLVTSFDANGDLSPTEDADPFEKIFAPKAATTADASEIVKAIFSTDADVREKYYMNDFEFQKRAPLDPEWDAEIPVVAKSTTTLAKTLRTEIKQIGDDRWSHSYDAAGELVHARILLPERDDE